MPKLYPKSPPNLKSIRTFTLDGIIQQDYIASMQRIRITRSRNRLTYTVVVCPTCQREVRQFSDGRLSRHYLLDNDLCPGPQLKTRAIRKQIREFLAESQK